MRAKPVARQELSDQTPRPRGAHGEWEIGAYLRRCERRSESITAHAVGGIARIAATRQAYIHAARCIHHRADSEASSGHARSRSGAVLPEVVSSGWDTELAFRAEGGRRCRGRPERRVGLPGEAGHSA